jgi:hypothetical protein
LFERHRQAEPRLDEVRRKVLAALPTSRREALKEARYSQRAASGQQGGAAAMLRKAWWELFWPSRRAWAGMAAVWLAVLAANLQLKATSPSAPAAGSARMKVLVQGFEQQRRLLAELLPPGKPAAAEPQPMPPRRPNPRPRSEGPVYFKAC